MAMSLRGRLQLGLALLLILTLGAGGVAIWAVQHWQSATAELLSAQAQGLRAQRLIGDLYRQIKEVLDTIVTDDPDARAEFFQLGGGVEENFAELDRHARSPEELRRITALHAAYGAVVAIAREIFDHLEGGRRAEALRLTEEDLERVAFPRAEGEVRALQAFYRAASEQLVQQNLAIGGLAKSLAVAAIILSSLSAVGLALLIRRWFIHPLEDISRSTAIISTGKLEHRVPIRARDELGRLAASINNMARDLKGIQEQLVQAERLAALGELSAYVAHNIRNPLASIRSAAQVGMQETSDPEGREILEDIIQAADRLEHWVRQLLSYTRPLALQRRRQNVNRLMEECLSVYKQAMGDKDLTPVLELDPDVPEIVMDPERMEQAVAAVLTNAIEASPPGGTITVQTAAAATAASSHLLLRIQDQGKGIAPELREQVFHPYFTTKANGMGLGLAIARKIIEQHKGNITLVNGGDGGTIAEITLPSVPADAEVDGEDPDH
jgi:signal transduction histidine kinase